MTNRTANGQRTGGNDSSSGNRAAKGRELEAFKRAHSQAETKRRLGSPAKRTPHAIIGNIIEFSGRNTDCGGTIKIMLNEPILRQENEDLVRERAREIIRRHGAITPIQVAIVLEIEFEGNFKNVAESTLADWVRSNFRFVGQQRKLNITTMPGLAKLGRTPQQAGCHRHREVSDEILGRVNALRNERKHANQIAEILSRELDREITVSMVRNWVDRYVRGNERKFIAATPASSS